MRILVFQGYLDPARRDADALLQAWPTLVGMAAAISRAGGDVEVVVASHADQRREVDGARFRFVADGNAPSPWRIMGGRGAPHPVRSLRATRGATPDVVHMHGLSFPLQARALRRLHPRAALVAQDHADAPPTGWRRAVHRWGYAVLDAAAFTAADQAVPFRVAGILGPGVRILTVPEGSSRFTPGDRAAARSSSGVQGAPAVAWVGRFVPEKDPLTALAAFSTFARAHPEARLWMAGAGGPLEPAVRRAVAEDPALAPRVHLLGRLPHPAVERLLRSADVLLAASVREGSGYAVVEALACGTPVAASDIPSHRALLGAGGDLAPPGDASALAAAVERVVAGGESARRAARRRFDEALTWDVLGRRLLEAYAELAHPAHPAGSSPPGRA